MGFSKTSNAETILASWRKRFTKRSLRSRRACVIRSAKESPSVECAASFPPACSTKVFENNFNWIEFYELISCENCSSVVDDHWSACRMADGGLGGGGMFQAGRERSAPAVSEGGGFQGESGWLEWQNLHRDRGSPRAKRRRLPSRGKNPGAIGRCGTAGPEGSTPDEA